MRRNDERAVYAALPSCGDKHVRVQKLCSVTTTSQVSESTERVPSTNIFLPNLFVQQSPALVVTLR